MSKKLIVFDVDGVLLKNKMGGFKDVLVVLGKEKEVKKLDKEYQKRKNSGPWGLNEVAKLYWGFSEEELKKTAFNYCKRNIREGAKEVLGELKRKRFLIGALSSTPKFIMESLAQILPLDFSEGTRLEFRDGIATGNIKRKVDRYIKAKILQEKIKNYKLRKKDVVVVGDSITDLPMTELAEVFIAICPKENIVKEKANKVIKSLFQLIEEL